MMPRMQIASMKTRQAAAALADAGAPGGRSGEEYIMWRDALRQERADKHTKNTPAFTAAFMQELADTAAAAAAVAAAAAQR